MNRPLGFVKREPNWKVCCTDSGLPVVMAFSSTLVVYLNLPEQRNRNKVGIVPTVAGEVDCVVLETAITSCAELNNLCYRDK